MNDIVVVGHQPQYMPYLGILHKISRADVFIIVDHVQYRRRYFHNRTYIKVNDLAQLLTIPVLTKGKYHAPISEIQINYSSDWVRKHLKTIRMGYSKAPFFSFYFEKIEAIFTKRYPLLSEFTSRLLEFFLKEFRLVSDIRYSSAMDIDGKKTDLLIHLLEGVKGTHYLSGGGARDYVEEQLLEREGFKHSFVEFSHPRYPQQGKQFLEGMGCIDLLFNCGKDGRKYILAGGG